MLKINWPPTATEKREMIAFSVFAAFAVFAVFFMNSALLTADMTSSGTAYAEATCYHKISGSSEMAKCGSQGCFFPDGRTCTPNGCFNADGTVADKPVDMDPICRNADGTERVNDTYSQSPTPPSYSEEKTYPDDNYSYPAYEEPRETGDFHPAAPDGSMAGSNDPLAKERMQRELTRLERDIQRIERDIARMGQKGIALDDADELLSKIKAKLSEAKNNMTSENQESFRWALEDAREIMDFDLREKLQMLEQGSHLTQFFRDSERMLKDMEREIGRIGKNGGETATSYNQIKELFKKAQSLYQAGDFEEAQWVMEDMHDLSRDFWDQMESTHRQSFEGDALRRGKDMLGNVESGLSEAKSMIQALAKQGKDISRLEELLEKAFALLTDLRAAVESEDQERAEDILQKLEFGVKEAFEKEVMNLTGHGFDEAWEDSYSSEDMVSSFDFEDEKAKKVMERVAAQMSQKIIAQLLAKGLPAAYVEDLANSGFEDHMKNTLESVSFMEKGASEIVSNKTAILSKISAIDEQIAALQKARKIAADKLAELGRVKDEIAGYNFASEAGADIQEKIQSFIDQAQNGSASEAEISSGITRLKAEAQNAFVSARKEKFEKGIIPFADTDDNQWYTSFAAEAKEEGLVEGTGDSNGTELNPGGNTNLAEAITLFGRMVGVDEGATPESKVGRGLPEWARPAAGTLENKGVDLDAIFEGKDAGDEASRAEVARLLKETLDLEGGDIGKFSDLGGIDDEEREAIAAVNFAGIMTGEGGTDRFNPDAPLNRAALVKVLVEGLEVQE